MNIVQKLSKSGIEIERIDLEKMMEEINVEDDDYEDMLGQGPYD